MKLFIPMNPPKKVPGLLQRGRQYYYQIKIDKKLYQGKLHTTVFSEACERLERARARLMKDPDQQFTGMQQWLEVFFSESKQRKWSEVNTRQCLRVFMDWFEERKSKPIELAEVRPRDIADFYDWLHVHRQIQEEGRRKYIYCLAKFFRWAQERELVTNSPVDWKTVKLEQLPPPILKRPCTAAEIQTLMTAERPPRCESWLASGIRETSEVELRYILFCGFHCGMRKAEILESQAGWFRLREGKNGVVRVQSTPHWQPKTRRSTRSIPLTKEFRDFLDTHFSESFIENSEESYMIAPDVKWGSHRYRYDPRRVFENLTRQTGLQWVTWHTMRHTFGSRLVSGGVSLYKVAKWLGDKPETVELHYGHLQPSFSDEIELGLHPDSE